jgi:hypothetical protein
MTKITADLFSFDTMRARFHPVRDIFAPQFMSQEIGVILALYCASTHLSRIAGGLPSREELQSGAALCRSLNRRLSCVDTQADEFSIMAVLGMICVDVQVRPQVCRRVRFDMRADMCRTIRQRDARHYQAISEACAR